MKMGKLVKIELLLIALLFCSCTLLAQRKNRPNWIEEKQSHITRWRIGVGAHLGEPSGMHLQLYKASGICTRTINIRKKFSIDLSISQEGRMFRELMINQNPSWEMDGIRAGVDAKIYFRIIFNPYIGIGTELGTRYLDRESVFSTDAVGRVGVEYKLFGVRTTTSSMLHGNIFAEGKYNHGLNHSFSYLLPTFGVRIHFL